MKNSIILLTFVLLSLSCPKISAYTQNIYTNGDYTIEGIFSYPETVQISLYLFKYKYNNTFEDLKLLTSSQNINNEYSFQIKFNEIVENDSEYKYIYCVSAKGSFFEHCSLFKDTDNPTEPTLLVSPTRPDSFPYKTSQTVNVTARSSTDKTSSIDYYEYLLSGDDWERGYYINIDVNDTLKFRTVDLAGNRSSEAILVVDWIDQSGPTTPRISVNNTEPTTEDVIISITTESTDSGSGIDGYYYSLGSSASLRNIYNNEFSVRYNSTINVFAKDNVGNISDASPIEITNIDKDAPSTPYISGFPTSWITGDVTLTAKSIDSGFGILGMEYKIGSGDWTESDISISHPWSIISIDIDTNESIQFRAIDILGNISRSSNITPKVDNQSPFTPVLVGNPASFVKDDILIECWTKDTGVGIDKILYKSNLQGEESWIRGSVISGSFLDDSGVSYDKKIVVQRSQNCLLEFKAIDILENESDVVSIIINKIDKEYPSITIDSSNHLTYSDNVGVINKRYFTNIGDTTIEEIPESQWIDGEPTFPGNFYGNYAIQVSDTAGNITTKIFTIDTLPPTISSEFNYNKQVNDSITLDFKASDNSGINIYSWRYKIGLDTTIWDSVTGSGNSINITLSNLDYGPNDIYVKVSDNLGNESPETYFNTVIYDDIDPILSSVKLSNINNEGDIAGELTVFESSLSFDWTNKEVKLVAFTNNTNDKIEYKIKSFTYLSKLPGSEEETTTYLEPKYITELKSFNQLNNPYHYQKYVIDIRITDLAGNENIYSGFEIKIDRTNPIITTGGVVSQKIYNKLIVDNLPDVDDQGKNPIVTVSDFEYSFNLSDWFELLLNSDGNGIAEYLGTEEPDKKLYFRYHDVAGNFDISDGIDFTCDLTAPVLTNIGVLGNSSFVDSTGKIKISTFPSWSGADYVESTLSYYISTISTKLADYSSIMWIPLTGTEISIKLSDFYQGEYYIHYSISDDVGNIGYSDSGLKFIVDKTEPVASEILSYYLDDTEYSSIEDLGFSPRLNIFLVPSGSDKYLTDKPGVISGYEIYKSSTSNGTYTSLSSSVDSDGKYPVALSNGISYIKTKAIDAAGNTSSPSDIKTYRVDSGYPSAVIIDCSSHPFAISEQNSVSNTDAYFNLSATAGLSGINKYNYKLYKTYEESYENIVSKNIEPIISDFSGTTLVLTGLVDNLKENDLFEYYYLVVEAESNNGHIGNTSSYRFRVDTAPPSVLTIESDTHPLYTSYYRSKDAFFTWQEPTDLTGIKQYYYQFVTNVHDEVHQDKIELLKAQIFDNSDGNLHNWNILDSRSISEDIQTIASQGLDTLVEVGDVSLLLIAEDWAEEKQFDEHRIKFDLVDPEIGFIYGSNSKYFNIESDYYDNNMDITFSWNTPTDSDSGLNLQNISLFTVNDDDGFAQVYPVSNGNDVLDLTTNSYTAYGLTKMATDYMIQLEILDNAGNKRVINQFFDNEGVINLVPDYAIPFDNTFYGYRVSGQTAINATAEMFIPENMAITIDDVIKESFLLDVAYNMTEFTDGEYSLPFNTATPLEFLISGFYFGAYGLNLDSNGLEITSPYIILPDEGRASFNDSILLSNPKSLSSKNRISALWNGYKELISNNKWVINSDTDLTFDLDGEDLYINSGYLSKVLVERGFDIYRDTDPVSMENIRLNSDWDIAQAELVSSISNPFIIENNNYKISAQVAILRDDKILIESGYLIVENQQFVSDGSLTKKIKFYDISITYDGVIERGLQFSFDPISYTYDGTDYNVTELDFTLSGLELSGNFILNETTYNYSGHIFDKVGLDESIAANIDTNIVINDFAGYTFEADSVFLKGSNIHISSGKINLPLNLGGPTSLTSVTKELILETSDLSVFQNGVWTIDNSVLSSLGYGSGLTLKSIKLGENDDGYYINFPLTELVLPTSVIDAENISLTNIYLNRNQSLSDSDLLSSHNLKIGDYDYLGTKIKYNGRDNLVEIDSLQLVTGDILESHINNIVFSDLSFNGNGIISFGESSDVRSLNKDGWNYTLSGFEQRSDGVYSNSILHLPEIYGNRDIEFPDFKIIQGGTYNSGTTSISQFVNIGGWRVLSSGLTIDRDKLNIIQSAVRLFSTMGSNELVMDDIVLKSDGTITGLGFKKANANFLSENGFEVRANSYQFDDDGILLSGNILLPEALQNSEGTLGLNYVSSDILLNPNGKIETLSTISSLEYNIGGIGVTGTNFNVKEQGLEVSNNTLKVVGFNNHQIGSIEYYASGEIKFGGKDFTPLTIRPFGTNSLIFNIRGIELTDDGLNLKSFVSLPESFALEYIYFDSLTLHADGSITSDAAVPHLEFNKLGTNFEFSDIYLDGDGFSIGDASITLPETMDSKVIELNNFRITSDGGFELGSSKVDPFDQWGYTFYIDNLSFGDLPSNSSKKGISFEGGVRLPSDFGVSELAGKRFSIRDLEVPYEGSVEKFTLSLDDTIDMRLFDKWDMSITGISVNEQFQIVINDGTIDLPKEFNSNGNEKPQLSIKDITIDPVDLSLNINSVTASNLSYTYNELDFTIESVSLSQDKGLEIKEGSVLIPENDPNNPKYPEGLDNLLLTIETLQINNDFTVGDLIVTAEKTISLPVINSLFYLEPLSGSDSWLLALEKTGDDLYLAASARVRLGNAFPPGIKNTYLNVGDSTDEYGIKINITTGSIERFNVAGDFVDPVTDKGLEYKLFGNSVETRGLGFSYIKESDLFELSVTGTTLTLDNNSVPDFLEGTDCEVTNFTIDQNGDVSEFKSEIILNGKKEFFPGIFLENWKIGIEANDKDNLFLFSILGNGDDGNIIELGNTFPIGIAGTKSSISNFSIDSNGKIGNIDFNITLNKELKLFNTLDIRGISNGAVDTTSGANLQFVNGEGGKDFIIKLTAGAILPDTLPNGFRGLEIPISDFTFNTSGKIISLDLGIADLDIDIYDELALEDGSIDILYDKENTDEFIFDIGGSIVMPSEIQTALGIESFDINDLKISTTEGLTSFEAGVTGDITSDLFAGMSFTFRDITVSSVGFSLTGSLNLPLTLAEGLPNSIELETFAMNWDGEITDISAGISNASVTVGGFNTEITNFIVNSDKITMDTFRITLPQQLGGIQVGFNYAGFDFDGNFFGECVLDKIESPDIAGFKIILYEPTLDIPNKRVSFSKVFARAPDFVGGMEIGINGVEVSPASLSISGGEFSLPDFTVGEGMGFKNVRVAFDINGSSYYVKGGGALIVPGLGSFEALVSFTNPSNIYPIGLEQAYFEWKAAGPGIAMGTTGMFLNGIRGGLTFGPPIELPAKLKPMFDNGTRVQLGLTVTDSIGGKQVQGSADIWLDITDWDWAFKGNLTVLDGMADAQVLAAVTGKGFYGNLRITLKFVEGEVEVYIFEESGKTIVSGSAAVRFKVLKGAIVDSHAWWHPTIHIPSSDYWLGKGIAQFGRFKKGSGFVNGVKGSIEIAWFDMSAFVKSNGSFDLWGADKYTLYTPFSGRSRGNKARNKSSSKVISLDSRGESSKTDNYNFNIPSGDSTKITRSGNTSDPSIKNEVDKLIFLVIYKEGDPVVTAISSTGEEYTKLSSNVAIERTEWGMYFVVTKPEAGEWSLKVDNMPSPNSYDIQVFGNRKTPELTLESFEYNNRLLDELYIVNGSLSSKTSGASVEVFARENRESFTGYKIYETETDNNGEFSIEIAPDLLDDGENFIIVKVNSGLDINLQSFIDGSVSIINYDNKLGAVQNLLLSEDINGDLVVNFDKIDNSRVKSYNLSLKNRDNDEVQDFNLGLMSRFVIPGLENVTYLASITAIDNTGNMGDTTEEYEYVLGKESETINNFNIEQENITLTAVAGEIVETVIDITTINPQVTDSSYDMVTPEIRRVDSDEEISWGIYPGYDSEIVDISNGETEFVLSLSVNNETVSGTYEFNLVLTNMGNKELSKSVPVTLTVNEPQVEITSVSPSLWDTETIGDFEVYGSGFTDGAKLYVDGIEIPTKSKSFGRMSAEIPLIFNKGDIEISIESPKGESSSIKIEGKGSSWGVLSYKSYSEVIAGSDTSLFYTIKSIDGFTGAVPFYIKNIPENWITNLDSQNASDGYISELNISIPAETIPGTYFFQISDSEENIIPVEILVTESNIKPTISSMSEFAVLPGDSLTIFGFGFNNTGEVFIGEQLQEIISWSSDKITIKTDYSVLSGKLKVVSGQLESNKIILNIKDRGFTIYPEKEIYNMQPGESVKIPLAVSGYSDYVILELLNQSENITAHLDDTYMELNGFTNLNITVDGLIANGSYPVVIKGSDGEIVSEKEIIIQIGYAYSFKTESIPVFMEGVTRSFIIESVFGDGESVFTIEEGDYLPSGLSLLKSGEISGKPIFAEKGKTVTIKAEDESGRVLSKDFEIIIEENSWPLSNKDGGNSGYNPMRSPAEDRIKWSRNTINNSRELIVANNRVFLRGENGIAVLSANSGTPLYTIDGNYTDYFYASETLFTLDDENVFTAWEVSLGNKKWDRENVLNITTDGFRLYLEEEKVVKEINLIDGQLINSYETSLMDSTIWFKNRLIGTDSNDIYQFDDGVWNKVYSLLNGNTSTMVSDDEELILLSDNGLLIKLNEEFTYISESDSLFYTGDLVLTDTDIIINNSGDIGIFDRETLSEKSRFQGISGTLVAAYEKLFIVGSGGLEARNRYNNGIIWNKTIPQSDITIVGEELYVLEADGTVKCYNGRDNIFAPITELLPAPLEPNGHNGYYTVAPDIELITSDAETYVEDILYKYDQLDFTSYSNPLTLPDGEYSCSGYSVDSNGVRGLTDSKYFKIDTLNPVTTNTMEYINGDRGYTVSDVTYNLIASDITSGVEDIFYILNGYESVYTDPILLNEEGEYTFTWWSEDKAGNIEESESVYKSLDLYKPEITMESYKDNESGTIYLYATDSYSGLNRIEYRINGGEIITYHDPINLSIGELYNVTYRAVDNAELKSDWYKMVMDLSDIEPTKLIQNFSTKWGNHKRYIDNSIQIGDPLYVFKNKRDEGLYNNTINSLPDYLIGGEMIVGDYKDKYIWDKEIYRFTAGKTIDLYTIRNKESQMEMDNTWMLVDSGISISGDFFLGGSDIYHKIVKKGDDVKISGTGMWARGGGNLIIAKQNLKADLKIFSPNPSKELFPLSTYWIAATKVEGEIDRQWSYKLNGEKEDIGHSFSGEFTIPYVPGDTTLEITVEVKAKNPVDNKIINIITKTSVYKVNNKEEIVLLEPVSGSEVLKNKPTELLYEVKGIRGEDMDVELSLSSENGEVIENIYQPEMTGLTTVSASFNIYENFILDKETILNVVENYTTETFDFGTNLTEEYMVHEDGRYFGFSYNYSQRVGETTYVDIPTGKYWSKDKITKEYIALEKDSNFQYRVNNGLYRVKITTAPINRYELPFIELEDEKVNINTSRGKKYYTIQTTIEVNDNNLTLSGSNNLQIINMEVERVNTPIKTTVKPVEGLRVIKDQKWYLWNPNHLFSEMD